MRCIRIYKAVRLVNTRTTFFSAGDNAMSRAATQMAGSSEAICLTWRVLRCPGPVKTRQDEQRGPIKRRETAGGFDAARGVEG